MFGLSGKTVFLIGVSVVVCPGVARAFIDPNNPSEGRFSDEWAEIYMAGGKAGYAHSTMTRDGDMIHTTADMKLRIGRAGKAVEMNITQGTTETLSGVPVQFNTAMNLARMTMTTQGTIKDGVVTITTSQYGMKQRQRYPFPEGALMTWGLFRTSLLHGFKPETKFTVDVYAPELRADGVVTLATTVGEWETFEHRGQTHKGQRVVAVMSSPIGSIETVSWVDKDGEPIRVKMPMPGLGSMEVVSVDQATAMKAFVEPEIFMTTTLSAKRSIDRDRTQRIRYRLTAATADAMLSALPVSAMQAVLPLDDTSVEVVEVRCPRRSGKPRASEAPLAALAQYLESNLMINPEDHKLIELAKLASPADGDPYELADRLRRFVTQYITSKNLDVGFATASEVARTKEGDCSEHGVLLAALGRVHGLPSRVVAGLAYVPMFGGQKDVFGYHLWTQFWIDGQWVDYDAALGESDCSPARIAFVTSSLKNAGLADLSFALLSKIGAVDLEILEVDPIPPR